MSAPGWAVLAPNYFDARRAIAAHGPDAVPARGPDFAGNHLKTEVFACAADAAERRLGMLSNDVGIGGAIAIATLAYIDASQDRADRERVPAHQNDPPPFNPFTFGYV